MNVDRKIVEALQKSIEQGQVVLSTRKSGYTEGEWSMYYDTINNEVVNQWGISCLNLLGRVFGKNSDHYIRFNELFPDFDEPTKVVKAFGILKGAKDDYERGYLFDTQALIQAEVFDDFLEQAKYLFDNGYHAPAAVIAGSVLEDGLRKLCDRTSISLPSKPKLDTMNAELAKAGVYNLLTQKKITALADLRNKAAHGKWTEFTPSDVEQMIAQIRAFMETHFS